MQQSLCCSAGCRPDAEASGEPWPARVREHDEAETSDARADEH